MAPVPIHSPATRAADEVAVAESHVVGDPGPNFLREDGCQACIAMHASAEQGNAAEIHSKLSEHLAGLCVALGRLDEDSRQCTRPPGQLPIPRHENSPLRLAQPENLRVRLPSGVHGVETDETKVPRDVAEHGVDHEARCWPVGSSGIGGSLSNEARCRRDCTSHIRSLLPEGAAANSKP
jgi:hypothetical protein